jgi:hypothetical protein
MITLAAGHGLDQGIVVQFPSSQPTNDASGWPSFGAVSAGPTSYTAELARPTAASLPQVHAVTQVGLDVCTTNRED